MADKDFIARVFQRATEEFDIEFNPVAWERMEKKLDRARRRRVLFYWLRWGGLAVVGVVLLWLLWQTFVSKEAKPQVAKPSLPIVEAPKRLEDPCVEPEVTAPQMPAVQDKVEETRQAFVEKTLPGNIPPNAGQSDSRKKNDVNKEEITNFNNSNIALQKNSSSEEIAGIDLQNKTTKETESGIIDFSTENIPGIALNVLKSKKTDESIRIKPIDFDSSDITPVRRVQQNRWVLGLSIAPETASVGFNNQSQLGYSLGILTEYRFARRFSLSAQGVYAQKRYVAGKGAFNRPGGWLYGLEPIETSGNCNMLEATLSLRTELWQRQHWNLVATTGVSTWWMLREGYDYEYEEHYPGLIYYWESDQTLTHWLAMAQLGIGAEIKLSQKLSAQADFYLQVPLQGVGRGQVQLYSQGVAISLRRRF